MWWKLILRVAVIVGKSEWAREKAKALAKKILGKAADKARVMLDSANAPTAEPRVGTGRIPPPPATGVTPAPPPSPLTGR